MIVDVGNILSLRKILNSAVVNLLVHIYLHGSVRHKDLVKLISSRGSLSLALNSLLDEGLVTREVDTQHFPPQTYYSVTERGKEVAARLEEIREIMKI